MITVLTPPRQPTRKSPIRLALFGASAAVPDSANCIVRKIDNYTANWKVIALINGDIEAVSGSAAQDRPGAHEWMVWQGKAADKAEALQSAEKADPRVDLEWMRIGYERDLNKR